VKKRLFTVLLILVVLLTFGCSSKKAAESAPEPSSKDQASRSSLPGPNSPNLDLNLAGKKVIKNADVNLTVKDNLKAEGQIQELVLQYQGFIQNTESYQNKDRSFTNMDVRIPAEGFESFLNAVKNVGELTHNRIYTTDVTEEYIDLSARQKTLLVQEERLQEMLKKANNVDELLKVENELGRVRGEKERKTGGRKIFG